MAIGIDGIIDYKVLDDCLRKDTFVSFFKDLVSKLPSHKNIIVMDNISFHHSKDVKNVADSLNKQIIYSPPYSPQFNPIEFLFSVIKKKYKEFVRNDSSFLKAIQLSIDTVNRDYKDITNMFIHSLKTETLEVLKD